MLDYSLFPLSLKPIEYQDFLYIIMLQAPWRRCHGDKTARENLTVK